jgi:hypothetical protein
MLAPGMDRMALNERHGIGTETIRRIVDADDKSAIARSTLSHLSLIFGLHHDYLRSVAYLLPLPGEPTATLDSLRAEVRETLGMMRTEQRQQGDIIRQIAPALGVELEPDRHTDH